MYSGDLELCAHNAFTMHSINSAAIYRKLFSITILRLLECSVLAFCFSGLCFSYVLIVDKFSFSMTPMTQLQ